MARHQKDVDSINGDGEKVSRRATQEENVNVSEK